MSSTSNSIQLIPLNQLTVAPGNVRKTGSQNVDQLAASIEAHGLLQNLVVVATETDSKWNVVAGGRRLAALRLLAKKKRISKTLPVPCQVRTVNETTELSLTENVIRQAMHPADQFEAFRRLIDDGMGEEEVAGRFGISVPVVRQRLRLARVSLRLFELYRQDGISLDQLMALAFTEDQEAQERVWDSCTEDWQRRPDHLKELITNGTVDASCDPRVAYVTVATYLEAGGQVEYDLFQEQHEGFLTNVALLDALVAKKLGEARESVKAEGWKWVEAQPELDHNFCSRCQYIYPTPSRKTAAEIRRLQEEAETLEQRDDPDTDQARLDEIDRQIDELRERSFRPAEMAVAGAIVSIGHDGREVVRRGLVLKEDKAALAALSKKGNASEDSSLETKPDPDDTGLSGALVADLTAHRTAALQASFALNPKVALVAVVHHFALAFHYEAYGPIDSALDLRCERLGRSLHQYSNTLEESPATAARNKQRKEWSERLPEREKLWSWLMEQPQEVLLQLLAFTVAQTVYAVRSPHSADSPYLRGARLLADALSLDMADWWDPAGEKYLSRVSKPLIADALAQIGKPIEADRLNSMKKADLVKTAEGALNGSRWLPAVLR